MDYEPTVADGHCNGLRGSGACGKDFEDQLKKIDLHRINSLLNAKKQEITPDAKPPRKETESDCDDMVNELGTINLLKISEHGNDAIKLSIFLAAGGMNQDDIKKITGITILSS